MLNTGSARCRVCYADLGFENTQMQQAAGYEEIEIVRCDCCETSYPAAAETMLANFSLADYRAKRQVSAIV